jgi:hypothetical protein
MQKAVGDDFGRDLHSTRFFLDRRFIRENQKSFEH